MATFDDFHGVYFSVQALRMFNPPEVLREVELVIVDNNPGGEHGKMIENFVGWLKGDLAAVRYIPAPEITGTSAPRERIFAEAQGDAVLCMDCHVLLWPGALEKLLAYYDQHPQTRDLLSGPMVYDDLKNFATHFDDQWRAEMWGTWGTDLRAERLDAEPIEIPACGLGLFTCRRDAWLHFNPRFHGFGGEEFYIHEKFRQAGAKCLCLPFLRWLHRFGRPDGVKYPLTRWDKIRNYVIGHAELGRDLQPIYDHFVTTGLMPQAEWHVLAADPHNPPDWPPAAPNSCGSCPGGGLANLSLEELYQSAAATPADINEHVPRLRELASACGHVTEFGMRHGVSTVALLAGQPGRFVSYDLNHDPIAEILKRRQGNTAFEFRRGSSLNVDIDPTDLLFVDTVHTGQHLHAELKKHQSKVSRWIVLHDTVVFGEIGEDGQPGLLAGVLQFLEEHPEWTVTEHATNNNGLMVLSKAEEDKEAVPGLALRALNFARALGRRVVSGQEDLPEEVQRKRLTLCLLCEDRNGFTCGRCGCPISKKTAWASESCPPVDAKTGEPRESKWGREDVKDVISH